MKKDTLILFGLVVLLITVSTEKKYGFSIYDIFLNIVVFSVSLICFIYSIWYKKVHNHISKLIFAGLIHLITSIIISKYIFITALLGYIGAYLYYSRKKNVSFIGVDPETESYLAVIRKNKMFFTKTPIYIVIGLYAIVVLAIAYKTLI